MDKKIQEKIRSIFDVELNRLELIQLSTEKWKQLERLHIIGQVIMTLHYQVHFMMLKLALKEGKNVEFFGQIFRILLVMPGHLLGRLPSGNIGTSRVSAFSRMELPEDLKDLRNSLHGSH